MLMRIDINPELEEAVFDIKLNPGCFTYVRELIKNVKCDVAVRATQTYTALGGDIRREEATMVKITFRKPDATHHALGATILITFTSAAGSGANNTKKEGVCVHVLDSSGISDSPFKVHSLTHLLTFLQI